MTNVAFPLDTLPGDHSRPIAVVDIGSNSVRLVVFDVYDRTLRPLFNEKVLCGLGRGLSKSKKLNPDGVMLAKENILRFARLVDAMGVERMDLIATAAVRDAKDGSDFVAEVEKLCGCRVQVLDGTEEGRLSAVGVTAGLQDAEGVVGDLGGGSLELVELQDGTPMRRCTLPLGPFRLIELCGRDISNMRREIDKQLSSIDWIEEKAAENGARTLYLVGGAWRNLARLHMEQRGYPLHVVHGYRLRRSEVEDIESVVGRMGSRSLSRIKFISRRRLETLPAAAIVLGRVLKALRYKEVIFSAYGLREGHVFEALPPREQVRDPLIVAAEEMAEAGSRFGGMAEELMAWTDPLFTDESKAQKRLRWASCLLSDIAWREHTDYRSEQALLRILYHPFTGIAHSERVFLAYAIYTRYGGPERSPDIEDFLGILSRRAARQARVLGLAQRLAYQVSGATGSVLKDSALRIDKNDRLCLKLPSKEVAPGGGVVERRIQALGDAVGANEIVIKG